MDDKKVDRTKVDSLTGAEAEKAGECLESVPEGQPANATSAVIPGTGKPVKTTDGEEHRMVTT